MIDQGTGIYKHDDFDAEFIFKIESICNSIASTGLDPYTQLMGYLLTGNDYYITRTGNARAMIETLEASQIQAYVSHYLEK